MTEPETRTGTHPGDQGRSNIRRGVNFSDVARWTVLRPVPWRWQFSDVKPPARNGHFFDLPLDAFHWLRRSVGYTGQSSILARFDDSGHRVSCKTLEKRCVLDCLHCLLACLLACFDAAETSMGRYGSQLSPGRRDPIFAPVGPIKCKCSGRVWAIVSRCSGLWVQDPRVYGSHENTLVKKSEIICISP